METKLKKHLTVVFVQKEEWEGTLQGSLALWPFGTQAEYIQERWAGNTVKHRRNKW